MSDLKVHLMHIEVSDALERLSKLFKPGMKISFIARLPGNGEADVLIGDDHDGDELIALVRRRFGIIDASELAGAQNAEAIRNQAEPEPIECWSRDEEDFNARSLADLLDSHDDLKPGDTVFVGEAVHPDPARLVNEESIIENIGEAAYDIGGEYAEDYPEVKPEQVKELESLVADWIKRNCPPTFYTVANIKPYVLSHEDFSGALQTGTANTQEGGNHE